jgi:hypothetical protein
MLGEPGLLGFLRLLGRIGSFVDFHRTDGYRR